MMDEDEIWPGYDAAQVRREVDALNHARMKRKIRRDLFWLCQRYLCHETPVGLAAGRLLAVHPLPGKSPQWHTDLQLVLDKVWEANQWGYYTSSLRAQGAAGRIEQMMKMEEESA